MTPNELIEGAAREIGRRYKCGANPELMAGARIVIRIALEDAIKVCEQQSHDFASDEYATPQPLASLCERFACAQCIDAIRALLPQDDGE